MSDFYIRDSSVIFNNTIIAENSAASGPDVYDARSNYLTGSNNLIGTESYRGFIGGSHGNLLGTSENPIDPRFVRNPSDGGDGWGDDPATPDIDESANDDYGDLRLRVESVAVDTGDATLLPADSTDLDGDDNTLEAIPVDVVGDARVQDGNGDQTAIVNMGAYETPVGTPPGDVTILYVNAAVALPGDGSSWAAAFADLQDALDLAAEFNTDGDGTNDVNHIWIAEGIYKPSVELVPGDPRSAAFSMVSGVAVYGGFAGTETAIAQRDWTEHETVLSGDLGVTDDPADNAYTVVYCGWNVVTALNGVTVTGGNADAPEEPEPSNAVRPESRRGGGIYNRGTLTIVNGTVSNSTAASYGGGVFNDGTLTISGGLISENTAGEEGSGGGGGVCNNYSSSLTVLDSTFADNKGVSGGGVFSGGTLTLLDAVFSDNTAQGDGGGIFAYNGTLTVVSNRFLGNTAGHDGGGICADGIFDDDPDAIVNCVFVGNTAARGGAVYGATLTVTNCTISGNTADSGAGIYSSGGSTLDESGELTLNNCILWKNNGDGPRPDAPFYEGTLSVSRNLIGIEPRFVRDPSDGGDGWGDDPDTPDIDESANDDYGDLHLTPTSIAINRGDDAAASAPDGSRLTADLDGNPRNYAGSAVDIGAFEFQGEPVNDREQASLVVDTTEDVLDLYDGRISLRDAVFYAGVDVPDTTITFDAALDGATITLGGAAVTVTKPVTIDASTLTSLTIDADHKSRAFEVTVSGDGEVVLDSLTITGGETTEDGGAIYNFQSTLTVIDCTIRGNSASTGGGIYNYQSTKTIVVEGTLSDAPVVGSGGTLMGPSLPSAVGTSPAYTEVPTGWLTLTNCTLTGNTAVRGGAIYNRGGMTVNDSVFLENSAISSGGGIRNDSQAVLTVNNSEFRGNSVDGTSWDRCGGAISSDGWLTTVNSLFVGNAARYGGGIASEGSLTVTNCTLADNSAEYGGGIYGSAWISIDLDLVGINPAVLNLLQSEIALPADAAVTSLPGVYVIPAATLELNNSILWHNSGGDLLYRHPGIRSTSHNLIGIDPRFVRDPSDGGDGWGDNPQTYDVDESANDDYGDLRLMAWSPAIDYANDALAVDASGDPLETDLDGNPRKAGGSPVDAGAYEFQGDVAPGREAASTIVDTVEDVFDLYDGRISLREAIHHAGTGSLGTKVTFAGSLEGATIVLGGTPIWIDKTLTVDASAPESLTIDGDGRSRVFTVTAHEEDAVTFAHLTITGGSTALGGGVYNTGTLTLEYCTVDGNTATDDGGGIYNAGTLTVTGGTVSRNGANDAGGGIYGAGTLVIAGSTLLGNTSGGDGGGIYNLGTMTVTNGRFLGNTAPCGGAICNGGTLTVVNNTISGNTAENGGGIFNFKTLAMHNSIVAENASPSGPDIQNGRRFYSILYPYAGTVTGTHNLIGDGSDQAELIHGTDGNLVGTSENPIDPMFVRDPSGGEHGDLRLLADSPATDAGDNALLPADTYDLDADGNTAEPVPFDLAGNYRVSGEAVDMGAYEFFVPSGISGDLNNDGVVDSADMGIVRAAWGRAVIPGSLPMGDPSGDGRVDSTDLDIVRANWGSTTPAAVAPTERDGGGIGERASVYGPRTAAETTIPSRNCAARAWAEAINLLARERQTDGETPIHAARVHAAAVDLALLQVSSEGVVPRSFVPTGPSRLRR